MLKQRMSVVVVVVVVDDDDDDDAVVVEKYLVGFLSLFICLHLFFFVFTATCMSLFSDDAMLIPILAFVSLCLSVSLSLSSGFDWLEARLACHACLCVLCMVHLLLINNSLLLILRQKEQEK
jgi:hypothetical protein